MKKFTRLFSLLLLAALTLGLWGCADPAEELVGKWTCTGWETADHATDLLEAIDLYEEEIALVSTSTLQYVRIFEFGADGTYSISCDLAGTKACVREYFASVMESLYENRASLAQVYEEDISLLSQEEFYLFYAALYQTDSLDALLDKLADSAYDYEAMAADVETGTYKASSVKIITTVTGESEAESLSYELEDGKLTLTYSNGVEVYTRDS